MILIIWFNKRIPTWKVTVIALMNFDIANEYRQLKSLALQKQTAVKFQTVKQHSPLRKINTQKKKKIFFFFLESGQVGLLVVVGSDVIAQVLMVFQKIFGGGHIARGFARIQIVFHVGNPSQLGITQPNIPVNYHIINDSHSNAIISYLSIISYKAIFLSTFVDIFGFFNVKISIFACSGQHFSAFRSTFELKGLNLLKFCFLKSKFWLLVVQVKHFQFIGQNWLTFWFLKSKFWLLVVQVNIFQFLGQN